MPARLMAFAVVASLALSGCGPSAASAPSAPSSATTDVRLPAGSSDHTLSVDGTDRDFIVHRPATTPPASGYALVVMLHGGFGSARQAERAYGWDQLSDETGFVVAYPDGLDRAWNAGSCCGIPARLGTDDVGFISAVVAQVGSAVPIDPSRVFATGMSNGAMMAYRLACETTLFAAIAPVSGDQMVDCADPSPVSLLHIHGTADTNVPLDGSPGHGFAKVDGPPIADVVDGWRRVDGCDAFAATGKPPVTTRTASCPHGRAVELVLVDGAGHQWPGSASGGYPGADKPSDAFDATRLIWDFFEKHPRA